MKTCFAFSRRWRRFWILSLCLTVWGGGFVKIASAALAPGWSISVVDISDDFVELDWAGLDSSEAPASFTLQYFFAGKWATAGTRGGAVDRAKLTGLQPEQTYTLRVLAVYDSLVVPSLTVQIETLRTFIGGIELSVPESAPDTILVEWQPQPDATGYYIEWYRLVQAGRGSWFAGSQEVLRPRATKYQIPDLEPELTYRVRAFAYVGSERTGWSPEAEETAKLGAPDDFNVTSLGQPPDVHMELNWESIVSVGPSGRIRIERAQWDGEFFAIHEALPNAGSWEDTSVFPGRFYTYRVRLDDGAGEQSGWAYDGGWSSRPAAPGELSVDEAYERQVHLSWSALPGPVDYVIERYRDLGRSGDSWREVGRTEAPVFVDGLDENLPLFPGNDYLYRVRAYFFGGLVRDSDSKLYQYSEWSGNVAVTTTASAPAAVTATLTAKGASFTVDWKDVSGETGFEIARREASMVGDFGPWSTIATRKADRTSVVDSRITIGNRYQYRVRSINRSGDSSWTESSIVSTATKVPVNVTIKVLSDTSVLVRWEAVAGADGYVVRRSGVTGLDEVDRVVRSGDTTELVLEGLSGFSRYWIRVKSTQDRGPDSDFGQNVYTRTLASLSASKSGTEVDLAWSDMTSDPALDISRYRIERRPPHGRWSEIADIPATEGEGFTDENVAHDSSFEYRMRGWEPEGGGKFTSYSVIDDVTIGPPPVNGFTVTTACLTALDLGWDPAYSAETLLILRREPGDAGFSVIDKIPGRETGYTFSELEEESTYDFGVVAANTRGESPLSVVTGTTDSRLPPPPGLLGVKVETLSTSAIRVSWSEVSGNRGYRIQRRLAGDSESQAPWIDVADLAKGASSYDDADLAGGTSYLYRVAAINACGEEGLFKQSSSVATWTVIEEWRVAHWGNETPAVVDGRLAYADQADFDGDGWPNIFEFWSGSNPNAGDSTPKVDIAVTDSVVRFTWRTRGDTDGLTPMFGLSRDLKTFAPYDEVAGAILETLPLATTLVVPKKSMTDDPQIGNRLFVRLTVGE